MSTIRAGKEAIVSEVAEKLTNAKATVFVEYAGLTVEVITNLRNDLRAEGVEFKVYKNRLVKLAADKAGYSDLNTELTGPNAIAFSNDDEVAAARIIAKHAKKYDVLKFKVGIFEGKVVDVDMLTSLANVPSREVLLTQIAAGLLQPITEIGRGLTMLDATHLKNAGSADAAPAKEVKVEEVKEEAVVETAEEAKEEVKVETPAEAVVEIKEEAIEAIEAVETAAEAVIEEIVEEANEAIEAVEEAAKDAE